MDISVITPFYRGNRYMEQLFGCIRAAALAAPEVEAELVLVNDSPECPISFEEEWVRGFSVCTVTNGSNSGIHRSRVNGLKQARGEFIWFLDQDDLLSEDAFASQMPLAKQADAVLANGFDQNPRSRGIIYQNRAHQSRAMQPEFYYRMGNQIVSPGHCMIRRSAIPEAWCENIVQRNGSDDLLLWLLMFHSGCRWEGNLRPLYTHVDTGENVSANTEKMISSSMEVLQILKKAGAVTAKQERQFLRSRRMAAIYAGKGKAGKLLAMLRYPDVALARMQMKRLKTLDDTGR